MLQLSDNRRSELRRLLRTLDPTGSATNFEFPEGFDFDRATAMVLAFVSSFRREIGNCRYEVGEALQDCSHHADVYLPGHVLKEGIPNTPTTLTFSNFGNMVSVFSEDNVEDTDLSRLVNLVEKHGYVYIPNELLAEPYTGRAGVKSWGVRFFHFL